MAGGLLLWLFWVCILRAATHSSFVTQVPDMVMANVGGSVTLECHHDSTNSKYCYTLTWRKIDPKTGILTENLNLNTTVPKKESGQTTICTVIISNATISDSGIYYCLLAHQGVFTGNGSRVVIKENQTESPVISIHTPSETRGGALVSLLCLVSGVVPSQVRVFWLIDGREEDSGLTMSTWTRNSHSATESTQNWFLLHADQWDRGVACTCVVQFEGRNITKTLKPRDSSETCMMLLYGASAAAFFTIIVVVLIVVYLCHEHLWVANVDLRHGTDTEGRWQKYVAEGSRQSQRTIRSSASEVQYATLDPTSLGRRTNTVLRSDFEEQSKNTLHR